MEAVSSNKRLLSDASGNAYFCSTIIRVMVHEDLVGFAFMNRIDILSTQFKRNLIPHRLSRNITMQRFLTIRNSTFTSCETPFI